MNSTIICDNVSKRFSRDYLTDSLRDALVSPLKRLFGANQAGKGRQGYFWAIKDLSFKVSPGEVLGIIGPNGSGKSTTLKLLSRILRPDNGSIETRGRVGALIELAAGFHPDLSGRENVFLNASILGMPKDEIAKKYDEIVEFAELEEFMDTPVKWYSSGMYARLGFSVAAHIDPEILLVDEVLSVGDIGFQQKCEKKIQGIKEKGLSIVFVSHNMSAIGAVCDKVLVINKGKAVYAGNPDEAIGAYTDLVREQKHVFNSGMVLSQANVKGQNGGNSLIFEPGDKCTVELQFKSSENFKNMNIGINARRKGNPTKIFDTHYTALTGERIAMKRDQVLEIAFDLSLNLSHGMYIIEIVAWDQLKNCPILTQDIDNIIIKSTVKTDGVAFLNPAVKEISLS